MIFCTKSCECTGRAAPSKVPILSVAVQVLSRDKKNTKGLFRRGRAHAALGRSEDALRDLQAAAQLAPGDKAIARESQVSSYASDVDVDTFCLLVGCRWVLLIECDPAVSFADSRQGCDMQADTIELCSPHFCLIYLVHYWQHMRITFTQQDNQSISDGQMNNMKMNSVSI